MEEEQRRALRRGRPQLVAELQVAPLWEPLEDRGLFTRPMLEELQSAGSRGDQARQLIIDLETRGKQAFPIFLSILQDTGQGGLADMLMEKCQALPAPLQLPDLRPVELELPGEKSTRNVSFPERLSIPVQAESERLQMSPTLAQGSAVDRRNHDLVYQLKAKPCGHCLVLNNVTFSRDSKLSSRDGSDVDCEKLEKTFKAFSFSVLTQRDLKAQEMVVELQKLARQDHRALDCCVVVILSHGCQTSHIQFPGAIYGTDGNLIPVEKIVNYFNGSNCPTLRGKPKLFFIQACGGDKRDRGFVVDCDSPAEEAPAGPLEADANPFQTPQGNADQPDAMACLPTPSDILVSYSTFPGYVSWREASRGSWYVETLVNVLQQCAHTEDLLSMLVKVTNAVAARGTYKQIPGCFNFLRKKFFFMCQ
ncbi:caspase-9 [Indicator indicator]|uniref:caspase-9 n=1 Tax=Indicator indicator TaxID=1002788 RepID=UPI0023E02EB8|nr:caspase-9 [Indicator indicator]